jgi:Caspase domain
VIKSFLQTVTAIAAVAALLVLAPGQARAEKRVALVVGNSAYQSVAQLANPMRDASAIAQMFRDAGFDSVETQLNVGNLELKRAIRKFEISVDDADIAVVYYAGHGIEIGGQNYLVPVDAKLASDRDVDDEAIVLDRLVSSTEGAKRFRLIILDACRDNPFLGKMRRDRKVPNVAAGGGLGRVEPISVDTLIAYAAKAGSVAEDGTGAHSPFADAIVKNLTVPGLDIRLAFGRIRDDVMKATGNRQEPFVYGALGGGNVSLVPARPAPQAASESDIRVDYELVQKIGTKRAWEVFLSSHPTGMHADLAREQIAKLDQMQLASLSPQEPQSVRLTSPKEAAAWDKIKQSNNPATLQAFIKQFPDSPLALLAQQRIDALSSEAKEREEAKRRAEQLKAEQAAQAKREQAERRARAAEEAEKAKAAAAEAAAQKQREEAERRAAAAEASRAADAAAARRSAELAAAKEATCKDEQGKLDAILAKGSDDAGLENLKAFSTTVTCDRLGPVVAAALARFNAEADKREAAQPNSPELMRSAQAELIRMGCLTGRPDGTSTRAALGRYFAISGKPANDLTVTTDLVVELGKRETPVCPVECQRNEVLKGDVCVADVQPEKSDKQEKAAVPAPAPAPARAERKPAPAQESQRPRQQATARPSNSSGGGHQMIGVGF